MMKISGALLSLAVVAAAGQTAQLPTDKPVQMVTPVFHQLVLFSLPPTFQLAAPEQVNATMYLHEIPLRGETVEHWTQLVTITGFNGMAANPNAAPDRLAGKLAGGFRKSCPQTFGYKILPPGTLPIAGSYAVLAGCGSVADLGGRPGAMHSETALILAIKGSQDVYTVQWAERTAAVSGPPVFYVAKWMRRLQTMEPIKVCTRVPGEKAPYPSCLKQ